MDDVFVVETDESEADIPDDFDGLELIEFEVVHLLANLGETASGPDVEGNYAVFVGFGDAERLH